MTGLTGHIVNRAATGGDRRVEAAPGVILRAPESFSALDDCLAEMRAEGVDRLVIDGGDGTVREVLSRAPEIWVGAPLSYAIVPNGNTNLIARHAGRIEADAVSQLTGAKAKSLNLMKVERAGERALRGFILGAGAYEKATRFAQKKVEARHGRQVVETVMTLLRSEELRAPTAIGLGLDGIEPAMEPRLLAAMTTFADPLILGLNPFRTREAGPLRYLDVAANPPHLLLAAGFLAAGRPRKWMRDHYRVGAAGHATLKLDTNFVMDGEAFSPGPDGRLRITAAETATFLSL